MAAEQDSDKAAKSGGEGASEEAPKPPSTPRKPGPQQIRQQQKHEEKLQDIREQVSDGRLVIRQMTPEERKRYPKPEPRPEGGRRRRRS
jgi:hypothetical protein